jgi:uncharacterized protein (DUF2344 family)
MKNQKKEPILPQSKKEEIPTVEEVVDEILYSKTSKKEIKMRQFRHKEKLDLAAASNPDIESETESVACHNYVVCDEKPSFIQDKETKFNVPCDYIGVENGYHVYRTSQKMVFPLEIEVW